MQTVQRGPVTGKRIVCVPEEGQIVMQRAKRLGTLGHGAQRNLLGEKTRRLNNEWENDRGLRDKEVEPLELDASVHNGPDVADNLSETTHQLAHFDFFAVVESEAFGIFTHADQGIPVIRVEFFSQEIEQNQRSADPESKHRGDQNVNKQGKDHTSRYGDACQR